MGRRVLRVTGDLMACILKGLAKAGPARYFDVTANALPDDATLVGCDCAWDSDVLELRLQSAAWDEANDDAYLPDVQLSVCNPPPMVLESPRLTPEREAELLGVGPDADEPTVTGGRT